AKGQGTFIMTASTGAQVAVEKPGDDHSLFTKHLLEGIRSGEADGDEDGLISVHELYGYVHDKVLAEGAQEPMHWGLNAKGMMSSLIIAKSGKDADKERKKKLRTKLHELAAQGLLTDSIVSEALHVIALPDKEMTAKDRACFLMIEQLADDRISSAEFVEKWVKTCLAPEFPQLPPPKAKLPLLILSAVCCAAAGAGWYFLLPPAPVPMGKISVPKRLGQFLSLPESSPLPLPPPAMRTISVPRQQLPSIGRYIHRYGTITDTQSGLMWKHCLECLSGVNCEEGKVETYTWAEAVRRFKNVEYAGYADLRMPTIDELKTLVHCSKGVNKKNGCCNDGSEKPTINQQAFPNTEASVVWSGSPKVGESSRAWDIHFYYGNSSSSSRDYSFAVRLVRGGQ
ncbi:MAG TPA: DUF1566 domain-containing protein, partial [Methylomicrobium sp.]|nr:DUF1566 domain-containing protein [Methylomicrobium sp.]